MKTRWFCSDIAKAVISQDADGKPWRLFNSFKRVLTAMKLWNPNSDKADYTQVCVFAHNAYEAIRHELHCAYAGRCRLSHFEPVGSGERQKCRKHGKDEEEVANSGMDIDAFGLRRDGESQALRPCYSPKLGGLNNLEIE